MVDRLERRHNSSSTAGRELTLGMRNWAHDVSSKIQYFHGTASEAFLRSWIVSAAVAIHIWGVCQMSAVFRGAPPGSIQSGARGLAGMSYSLYLLHLPLLYMIAYWWADNTSIWFVLVAVPTIFLSSYLFSRMTEARRHDLRKWLTHQRPG
jgi:peptidoglycan/LPS O-acetylase OafA/YrhL